MNLTAFVHGLPKVELHVHLEGSVRPETVLKLARRHGVQLPADSVEGLREWYVFRDFPHFVEIYVAISKCIRTPDDLELIAREFLEGQSSQNIRHSDVTFTAMTIEQFAGISWADQLAALNRAQAYGERELNSTMSLILDIVRGCSAERAMEVAQWAVTAHGNGVGALGLAGEERRGVSSEYQAAFDHALSNGLPIIPHAGETEGAWSVRDCIAATKPRRIGHGVRCLEDDTVVQHLRDHAITLEVCPSSNVCLGVVPDLAHHPLPKLIAEGLNVTINSDDPPMFNTTLTDEFLKCATTFGFTAEELRAFTLNAARVALVDEARRVDLLREIDAYALAGTEIKTDTMKP